jgi:sucrose-phosphate synthase
MHISFLNPQGNFDPPDSHLTRHPDFGGQLVYVKELAIQLGRLGHQVDLCARRIVDPEWPEFSSPEDAYPCEPNVRILRFDCGPPEFIAKEDLWPYLPEWVDRIAEYYHEGGNRPDMFAAQYADGGLAGALLQHRLGIPFTQTCHSLGAMKMERLIEEPEQFDLIVDRYNFNHRIAAERCALSNSSVIVASSRIERFEHLSHHLYEDVLDVQDDDKFASVSPGVNLDVFSQDSISPSETDVATMIEEKIHRDIPLARRHLPMVMCSSRLVPKKNIIGLVRSWAESETLMASANLTISITGAEEPLRSLESYFTEQENILLDEIRELINERNLWPCIMTVCLEKQTDLAAAYRHFAKYHQGVFALTAFHEPFGLSPLEAMACGMPVVVTQNGGPSESLKDNAGVLIDPYDSDDIASGILKLVQRRDSWEEHREAGLRRVHDHYTWPKTAAGYVEVFERVTRGHVASDQAFPCPITKDGILEATFSPNWLNSLWKGELNG